MNLALFWHQHSETVWATLCAVVITWFFSWFFYYRSESPKRFSWDLISNNSIIHTVEGERANLKVIYKENEVSNPNIVVLRLGNSGRKTITDRDFDNNVKSTISFGTSKLLSAQVAGKSSNSVVATIAVDSADPDVLVFDPPFLKPGEWFDVQVVTDSELTTPKVESRFDGSVGALNREVTKRLSFRLRVFLIIVAVLALAGLLFGAWQGLQDIIRGEVTLTRLIAAVTITLGTIAFFSWLFRGPRGPWK